VTDEELIAELRKLAWSFGNDAADRIKGLKARADAALAENVRLREALAAIYEITVEPAETDHHAVRGWIEVTARAALKGDKP
jgi:hypothetical protein